MNLIALVCGLTLIGSEDYEAREFGQRMASRAAHGRYPECGGLIFHHAACHTSAEVRSRANRIFARTAGHHVNSFRPSGVPVWPCIDAAALPLPLVCQWVEDRLRCLAEADPGNSLRSVNAGVGPLYPSYRRATELLVRHLLLDGWSHRAVDALVGELWLREIKWYHDRPNYRHEMIAALSWSVWTDGYPSPAGGYVPEPCGRGFVPFGFPLPMPGPFGFGIPGPWGG